MTALRRQSGIAMPVAIAVMLITMVLAGTGIAVAIHTNSLSNRDTGTKAALEAANAGLRAAAYRLNMFRPDGTHCPTAAAPPPAVGSGNLCGRDGPEALGNGSTFSYWVSGALADTDPCAGTTVSNSAGAIAQRCITATGTANGVSARVQERVAAYNSQPLFPTAIFGTKSVTINNNATLTGAVVGGTAYYAMAGTNGTLTVGGGTTTIDGYSIGPSATTNIASGITNNGPIIPRTSPWPTLTPVNPGTSWQNTSYPGGTCGPPAPNPQTNCNYRIANGLDAKSGNVTFTASTRVLSLGNNSSLTLAGGVYNFCNLTMSNNSTIYIAPGAQTTIYIDSPADPNSGQVGSLTNPPCGLGTGTFSMAQNAALNPGTGSNALNAQVYVYGNPAILPPTLGSNSTQLSNNSNSAYTLYAPYSAVTLSPSNNSTFTGAIVGYTVTIGNASHFTYEPSTNTLQAGSLGVFFRTYWEQCPSQSTSPTDPTAGC